MRGREGVELLHWERDAGGLLFRSSLHPGQNGCPASAYLEFCVELALEGGRHFSTIED